MIRFGVLLTAVTVFIATVVARGQQRTSPSASKSSKFNPMLVSKRPPAVCGAYLYEVGEAAGTAAFRRLFFVSEALASAEYGAKEGQESVAKMKTTENLTQMWAESLNGEEAWVNHMLCAAQIMYRYAPSHTDDPESTIAVLLTVAYNQQAHAIQMLASSQKRRFTRTSAVTPAQEIADAEELHQIQLEQDDSADSVTKVGMLAAAEAEDLGDADSVKVANLLLTCSERQKIDDLLSPISSDQESLFGMTARKMQSVLGDKHCR